MAEERDSDAATAPTQLSGAILAGGKSTRMGSNKALMRLNGEPMIARVARVLSSCRAIDEVMLITSAPADYVFLNLPAHGDFYFGKGPLAGIHSALRHARHARVLMVACDLPFITAALLDYLCAESAAHEITALESEKGVEPLCAVYAKSCTAAIERQLLEGRLKVAEIFDKVNTRIMKLEPSLPGYRPHLFTNVNTPEDFSATVEALGDSS